MQKLLIGISAPQIAIAQAAIATMGSALNLHHTSMRQPMVNMLAALLGEDPVNLDYKISGATHIKELATTAEALEASLALCLRNKASNFFIQRAVAAMEAADQSASGEFYSGHIISGLRTEQESKWIRDQGGIVIHIYDYSAVGQCQFHALAEKDGDTVIVTSESFPTTESNVWKVIHGIRELFGIDIKAA